MHSSADLPPGWQLKEIVQRYLATVPHRVGETVQLGWFVFRIADDSVPPEIETLDFRKMGSFTTDFTFAERIRALQTDALGRYDVKSEYCTLLQWALVSRSYAPGSDAAFLHRQQPSSESDSGWYVGMTDDEMDLDDEGSFDRVSLYELSIADERMLPFWLLPVGTKVMLNNSHVFE